MSKIDKTSVGDILNVADMPDEFSFVSDTQDVRYIKEYLGISGEEYDSFFVGVDRGDYSYVFGMRGIIPYLERSVVRVR